MPLTAATSFLVISLNSLVRPRSRHRDTAFLFSRRRNAKGSSDENGSDGDRDSDTDTDTDSEEEGSFRPVRSTAPPIPTARGPSTTESRTHTVMSFPQTGSGEAGTSIPTGTPAVGATGPSTITFPPSRTLPYFSQASDAPRPTFTASDGTIVPVDTSSSSSTPTSSTVSLPRQGIRLGNGAIVGIVIGMAIIFGLVWMLILKFCKRKRRIQKLPRGFDPSTIMVDNHSFRASVTELPVTAPTNTTTTSTTPTSGRALSPFAAAWRISSPSESPLPHNPPPPPGLGKPGYSSYTSHRSRLSLDASGSSGDGRKSTPLQYESSESYQSRYLSKPVSAHSGGGNGSLDSSAPVMSSVQQSSGFVGGASPPVAATAVHLQQAPSSGYDEEEELDSHHDPPPSYGQAF